MSRLSSAIVAFGHPQSPPEESLQRDKDVVLRDLVMVLQGILGQNNSSTSLCQHPPGKEELSAFQHCRDQSKTINWALPCQDGEGGRKNMHLCSGVPPAEPSDASYTLHLLPPTDCDVPLPEAASTIHSTWACAAARAPSAENVMPPLQVPWFHDTITLQIMNLPARCTLQHLLAAWSNLGTYNYVYLPYSKKHRRTVSYAFVNFTSPQAARDFCDRWQGATFASPDLIARQALRVQPATVQGLHDNLMTFAQSAQSTNAKHAPAVFSGSRRLDIQKVLQLAQDSAHSWRNSCDGSRHFCTQ